MKRPFTLKLLIRSVLMAALFLFHSCQQQEQGSFQEEAVQFTVSEKNQSLLAEAKNYDLAFEPGEIVIREETKAQWKMGLGNAVSEPKKVINESEKITDVLYEEAFDKVDVRFYDKGKANVGYDLIVAPHGDVSDIQIELESDGEERPYLEEGELVLPSSNEEIRHSAPITYQMIDGQQVNRESHFVLTTDEAGHTFLGFDVLEADPDYAIVIDPTIYSMMALGDFEVSVSASTGTINAGNSVVYTINYSTGATASTVNSAMVELTIPVPELTGSLITYTLSPDVQSINVFQSGSDWKVKVNFLSPLPAGLTSSFQVTVLYPAGNFCDGTEVEVSAEATANGGPSDGNTSDNSSTVTINDPAQPWLIELTNPGGVKDLGQTTIYNVTVKPQNNSPFSLESKVTLDVPDGATVVSCDGCENPAADPLVWASTTYTSATTYAVQIQYTDPPFAEDQTVALTAMLMDAINPVCDEEVTGSDDVSGKIPKFQPQPSVNCITPVISSTRIGTNGEVRVFFANNGNVDLDNFTVDIELPDEAKITSIPDGTYNLDMLQAATVTVLTNGPNNGQQYNFGILTVGTPGGGNAGLTLDPGEFVTGVKYEFGTVPAGFAVTGTINFSYSLMTTDIDGDPVEGANPRIVSPTCLACSSDNPNSFGYNCMSAQITVSGEYEGQSVDRTPCSASRVVTDAPDGPQNLVKSSGTPPNGQAGYFPEDVVTFTISFDQCGSDLDNGTITDNLPAGLTFLNTISFAGNSGPIAIGAPAVNGQEIVWTLPDPLTGDADCESYTLTFTAEVDEEVPAGTLRNCFTLDGDMAVDDDLEECVSELTRCHDITILPVGPVTPMKSVTDNTAPIGTYFPGDVVTYTLMWTHQSMFEVTELNVIDQLPPDISFVGNIQYSGNIQALLDANPSVSPFTQNGQQLIWDFDNIVFPGDNASFKIMFDAQIENNTSPGSLNNCFTVEGMGDNVRMDAVEDCQAVNVAAVGPVNLAKGAFQNGSPIDEVFPNSTFDYVVSFRNQGSQPVSDIVIVDILPSFIEFVEEEPVMYTNIVDPTDFVYDEVNQSLTWTWDGPIAGADPGEVAGDLIEIKFKVRVKPGTAQNILIENCVTIDAQGTDISTRRRVEDGRNILARACTDADLVVLQFAKLTSRKGIKGECDDDFVYFDPFGPSPNLNNLNGIGRTFSGGNATYRLEVFNPGNVVMKDFVLIDILPFIGDMGVKRIDEMRGTEWRPNLTAPIPEPSAGVEIYYSFEQNPCRSEFDPDISPTGCSGPNWIRPAPANITDVQAVKIVFTDRNIQPGETILFEWDITAPVGTPTDLIAWNSFAYQVTRADDNNTFLVAEPNKVGLAVKDDPTLASIGNYVWIDDNLDGINNEGPGNGVNGVKVTLWRSFNSQKGDGDDEMVSMTFTGYDNLGNPGYYSFPGLEPGNYYLVFDQTTIPPTTDITLDNQGGDDTMDSDPDPVMAMTELTTLDPGEDDTSWDLGLTPPDCDLQSTVIVPSCDDNGTPDNLDDDKISIQSITAFREGSAGGNTYTMIIEKCVEGQPGAEQLEPLAIDFEYGQEYGPFGPYDLASNESIKVTIVDNENPGCRIIDEVLGCYDFGDLPDSYTTSGAGAPRHIVQDDKYLGSCVDTDVDGNPSDEADGDNENDGARQEGQCGEGGDEDGIQFLTPLIPGEEACIRVTYVAPAEGAKLNAFIDFNGDGDFDIGDPATDDQLDFYAPGDPGSADLDGILPAGQNQVDLCFIVPDDAPLRDAKLFARFRLSCDGGLGPTGDDPQGGVPPGEVEDYVVKVAKVGNLVWEDRDFDGIQDEGEPGIAGVEVTLTYVDQTTGVDITRVTTTDDDGEYYFCNLIASESGTYKLSVKTPEGWSPAEDEQGENENLNSDNNTSFTMDGMLIVETDPFSITDPMGLPLDEDGLLDQETGDSDVIDPETNAEDPNAVGEYMDSQIDQSFDFAFTPLDYGDLPAPYATLNADDGARHTLFSDNSLYMGQTVDPERDGAPDAMAGESTSGGDDNTLSPDDEDGLEKPAMIFAGEKTTFKVDVVNTTGNPAYLYAFVDWNNDGDFDDESETANAVINSSTNDVELMFVVPDNNTTVLYTPLAVRLRLGSIEGQVSSPTGLAVNGEIEDYQVEVKGLDYGDLPDILSGVSTNDYQTIDENNGPRHGVPENPLVFFGEKVDVDNDGQPDLGAGEDGTDGDDGDGMDDEDGVMAPPMIFRGEEATFNVELMITNNSDEPAYVYGFIDWNADGVLSTNPADNEIVGITVPGGSGTVTETLTFDVPLGSVAYQPLGARFRIGTVEDEVKVPNGFAMDGEVEDYLVRVKGLDFGDLPDPYPTVDADNGARHAVAPIPEIYLGESVDVDDDGQPEDKAGEEAGGDDGDAANGDDEDGVTEPAMIFRGEKAVFNVQVVNNTDGPAHLYGFIDWNNNGTFDQPTDINEIQSIEIAANTSEEVMLMYDVPLDAVINNDLGARFRIGSDEDQVDQATGFAMDGEVEDYVVSVKGLDFGDLPDGYPTTDNDNGARHGQPEDPQIFFGGEPDVEEDGQPDEDAGEVAGGDEADEDGIVEPAMLFRGEEARFKVNVTNNTGQTAFIYGFIDWNNNDVFDGGAEVASATIDGSGMTELVFQVPLDAAINTDLGARFRIGTVQDEVDDPTGFAMDGEVEDYLIRVKGLDFGDLEDYPTTDAEDGPRHGVSEDPTVFLGGQPDVEGDGQPDEDAGEIDGGDEGDEDGIVEPAMIFRGEKATFTATASNGSGTTAYLYAFADWNGDGDFDDENEITGVEVPNGSVDEEFMLMFEVPEEAVINTDLGVRFRIGTVEEEVSKPTGFAMDGEVEDYEVRVKGLDYGDLPDLLPGVSTGDYQTIDENEGPRHGVPEDPQVFFGDIVDVDDDGQPDLGAGEDGTDGDDGDGMDDEDGVMAPPMIFRGEEAAFNVELMVTNTSTTLAYIYGYIDWNGDGTFDDMGEVASASTATSGTIMLTFDVPLGSVAYQPLGARFRIGTVEDEVKVPNGFAMDGEVEDYLVRVKGLDFGDLPDPYPTVDADNGARHAVAPIPEIYMGETVDVDDDGQPEDKAGEEAGGDDGDAVDGDDEDGVTEPAMIFRGEKATFNVQVVNNTDGPAYLYGFIDWNKNGTFDQPTDINEIQSVEIAANTSEEVMLMYDVPLDAVINDDLGARFRIGSDEDQVDQVTGFAMDGEVEDYVVRVKGLDFGDLPAGYPTADNDNGPRHGQPENPQVFFGGQPDVEEDGQPDDDAGEIAGGDGVDEDGIVEPAMIFRGEEARFKVNVTNTSGQTAFIYGFIDWDNDDQFDGPNEVASATIDGSGMTELVFQVPLDAAVYADLGARFRIGTVQDEVDDPIGFAMDGEVEDYLVQVKGLDFGDAGEDFPTTYNEDGARHGVPETPDLFFGEDEDIEVNGQPDDDAGETGGGDDGNDDDEDGVNFVDAEGNPTMLITCLETTVEINTVIPDGVTAYMQAWIDFNDDGDWADAGEQVATDVALTSNDATYYLTFTVPCEATITDQTFLRFRLSTVPGLSFTGFAMDGEVEDYVEVIKGLDLGDLPEAYPTELSENGPHHVLDPTAEDLFLGELVDADTDGAPSDMADGDDNEEDVDDEDGITFITPVMENEVACIKVDAVNDGAAPATLYAFADFDGDGVLEALDFVGGNPVVPNGGLDDATFCFNVPEIDEEATNGMIYFRFRLSTDDAAAEPTGIAMDGEVEDYKRNFAKVGNVVWFDRNYNGIQDNSEADYGLPGIQVNLIFTDADDVERTYTTTTDENGEYYFCGLIEGKYTIEIDNPAMMMPTMVNVNEALEDDKDSDGVPVDEDGNALDNNVGAVGVMEMFIIEDVLDNPTDEEGIEDQEIVAGFPTNDVEGYPDSQVDQTHDFGFVAADFGDLPESYATLLEDNGPRHVILPEPFQPLLPEIPNLFLGQTVDIEEDGQPTGMSDGDDENGDDEDGVELVKPLIPGYESCVKVTSNIPVGVTGVLQGWIDFNGNGELDGNDQIIKDRVLLSGENVETEICFEVPAEAAFSEGMAFARFRLSQAAGLLPTGGAPDGEVEDYKFPLGKLGNLVWEDFDFDGFQDEEEPGIEGVEVILVWLGADQELDTDDDEIYETTTDELGVYYFCGLINGDYKIIVNTPEDMTPTRPDAGGANNDDERDSDGQISDDMDFSMVMTEIIEIDDVTDLVTLEDGSQDKGADGVNGFPDNQVDETYDFGFAGLDYGDLPEEAQDEAFNTRMEENGPIHVIRPDLYLGECVDGERDGSPDNDAGQFDGEDGDNDLGDDGSDSTFDRPEACEDDENGIEFITPLIPENEACIRVTYTAPTEGAVLQGWIDWNGNGEFDLPGEALDLPNGGYLNQGLDMSADLCFEVPEDAVFNDGVAYARFRLSENGGLSPDGPDKYDEAVAVPGGEVEDYRVKLGKVGNLVWEDRNHNGLQDEEEIELGINGVAIQLIFGGIRPDGTLDEIGDAGIMDDRVYDTKTATREYMDGSELAGLYYYCGLIEGNYEIVVMDPKDLTPTKPNNIKNANEEDRDSDGIVVEGELKVKTSFTFEDQMRLMNLAEGEEGIGDQDLDNLLDPNMVGTFADNQVDQRFDFGYVAIDFGDLPVADLGDEYQYETELPLGPKHIVTPDLFLGSCVDAELDGSPDEEAGYKGNGNDLGDDATDDDPESWKQPKDTDCTDDEDGIEFVTPLVPGYEACIELSFNAIDNFDGPDAFLNAWIDFNGNGQLDDEEHIDFTKVNGNDATLEPLTKALELENGFKLDGDPVTICFEVPEDAKFLDGAAFMRFRLSFDPRLGPDDMLPNGEIPFGEVEDYFLPLTKVGNLVWEDRNFDGYQDEAESDLGINDVPVALIFSGRDGVIETTDVTDPQGDDRVYETTTATIDDVAGLYYFCGLIENNTFDYDYKIVVQTPEDMTPTRPDRTNLDDVFDSDGEDGTAAEGNNTDGIIDDVLSGMVMTEFEIVDADGQLLGEAGIGDDHGTAPQLVLTFPDEHANQSFDFGFAGLDYGDLPDDPDNPDDFNTLMMSDGAVHVIQPGKYLGSCVDAEREAAPEDKAGLLEGGDDNTESAFRRPAECGDDENGVILTTPMVVGYEACFEVSVTWPAGETAYLVAWIDYNSNNRFEPEEKVAFNSDLGPNPIVEITGTGGVQTLDLCFLVPGYADFPEGRAHARFRLSGNPDLGPDGPAKYGNDFMPDGEVEDYLFPLSKIGNLVWEDNNLDGIQDGPLGDPSEPGFEGIEMTLVYAGFGEEEFGDGDDRVYITTTNEEGLYYFCGLVPGKYQVYMDKFVECTDDWQEEEPIRWILTVPNNEVGDKGDQFDSDGAPAAMVMIPDPMDLIRNEMGIGDDPGNINQYPDSLDNLTIDFGLIQEPNIEAILNDVGYDYPTSFECGHINVIMDLCIKNTESVPLENLQAMLDLRSQFGPGFVQFVSAEVVVDEAKEVEEYPVVTRTYNGGEGHILDGTSGLLYPGQEVCIRITVEINPEAEGASDPLMAQASVSAKAVNFEGVPIPDWCNGGEQFMVMDRSNDGKYFQGGYDDRDEKTNLSDCWKDADLIAQNDVVYVPVDGNCQMTITADMLLEGLKDQCTDEFFPLGGFYRVRYNDEEFKGEITVDVSDYNVGEPLVFEVRQIADFCNPVWGYVVPEDKEGAFIPEVNGELMLTCTDVDSLKKYFEADITQDKDDCSFSGVSWDLLREAGVFNIDELQDGCFDICALDIAISDLFMERDDCEGSMMLRTMRIKDVKGNVSTVQIPIRFKPVDLILDEIMEDRELDLCAHPGASENDLLRITGAPYYINGFGDKVYIDKEILNDENKGGLCNVSVAYEDQVIPDNCVRKVIRTWTIWDWCKDEAPITKVQNIKWGQLSAPLVTCPPRHTDTVSTGPFDCTASFIVPAPLVDGCVNNEFEYTIKVYKEQIKRDPTGLPVKPREYETVLYPAQVKAQADGTYLVGGLDMGTYYIGYNVTDACGNVADEVRCKYVVKDLSAPVAVCDDELHVSVGGDGISHITVEDVDEGSWDNCELVDIKIRRGLDSCYDSYLNEVYQIASIDELHEIETVDKFGNPLFLYYRVEGGKDTLIMKEFVNDSTYKFFTYWKDELWFTCCDISKGPEDFVRIELKATDAHGNENVCWMDQLIENKQVAECWAPEGFDIACTDLNFDPADYAQVVAALGEAADLVTVDFNCAASLSDTIKWEPTDCSEGVLTRIFSVTTFTAKGAVVNTCEQVINIYNVNDYLIKFPGDAEDTCDGDGGDDLELTTYACDVFAVNRDTAIFEANDDACFKRYVTYRIINWCEYDGVSLEPTIIPRDVDCDGDFSESTWVRVEGAADRENRVWIDDDNAPKEEPVITFVRDADSYTSLACDDNKEYWITPGYWEYTQVVKVYDDEAPIISFDTLEFCAFGTTGAADCQAEVMIPVSVVDSCTELVDIREVLIDVNAQGKPVNAIDELYTATLEGDTLMIASIAGVGLPVGEHKFLVRTADQCGNVANREIPFSIVDCKSPAPICTSILSVDLMPIVENKQVVGGANTVWATDFIASGVIDCTPHPDADVIPGSDNNVRYYAIRQDEVIDSIGTETPTAEELAAYMADVDAGRDFEDFREVLFDCADNGAAITVFVIGVDGAGNLDYCTVMVNVQPGVDPDPCTGEATPDTTGRLSVAGLITTMEDELVEGVEVMLSGQEFAEMRTGTEGVYSFDGLQGGYDYSVTPRMDVDPMNGVSTFDLVKITQHILGTQALDHPLLMIAADVNNSQSITTIDLIQLRKLILSLDDHFSNNTSWRFIDASYEFPDPSNPWAEPFPEIVNINDLEDMMLDVDFYAVKVGDVNMSAVANSLDIEERNVAGVFELKAEDQYIEAGQTYAVTLSSEQLNEVLGYQYTLTYDNNVLELQDIDYGLLGEQNIGLRYVEEGMITVSWNEVAGLETTTAESSANDLITLHFRAYQSGQLSELLGISSRYTMAEAYDLNGQLQDVVIRFSDGSVKGVSYELYQNMPNPFMTQTTIGFHLPQADKAQMILRDAKGKVLQIVRGDYAKGYNMIRFERDNLPTGVIYYSLQSGDYTATRRMIIIE